MGLKTRKLNFERNTSLEKLANQFDVKFETLERIDICLLSTFIESVLNDNTTFKFSAISKMTKGVIKPKFALIHAEADNEDVVLKMDKNGIYVFSTKEQYIPLVKIAFQKWCKVLRNERNKEK